MKIIKKNKVIIGILLLTLIVSFIYTVYLVEKNRESLLDRVDKLEYIVFDLNKQIIALDNNSVSTEEVEKIVMRINYLTLKEHGVERRLAYITDLLSTKKPYLADVRKYFNENMNKLIANHADEIKNAEFNRIKEKIVNYLDIISEVRYEILNTRNSEFAFK